MKKHTWTAARVLALRQARDWSQEELARQLSVCLATVNRWENGHARPSWMAAERLERLANGKAA